MNDRSSCRSRSAIDKTGLDLVPEPVAQRLRDPADHASAPTRNFYPDFLVWQGNDVLAIDTTGGHLLADKTGRKLLVDRAAQATRPVG